MICALSFRERLAPASRNVHIYGAENSFLTDFGKEIQLYMKCQGCGEQIPEGKIYCEKCGMAVQMVPDYNPVEDIAIGAEEEPDGTDGDFCWRGCFCRSSVLVPFRSPII